MTLGATEQTETSLLAEYVPLCFWSPGTLDSGRVTKLRDKTGHLLLSSLFSNFPSQPLIEFFIAFIPVVSELANGFING